MRKFSIVLKCLCTIALFALSGSILAQNTAGLDTATGQSNDEVTETIGALAPAMTVDEIALELSNPVTALSSVATDIQYRTFQGSLPGADDKTSYIYLFKPSFPIPLSIDSVNRAIYLYDELCIQAQEIDDEATHRMLPAESIATQAPIPEPFPKNRFG